MATRNRIIYQSQAVALQGAATNNSPVVIPGVQSITYGIDVTREDVNQFGTIGAVDRVVTEAPTATQEVQFHFPNGVTTAAMLNSLITGSLSSDENGLIIGLDDEGSEFGESELPAENVSLLGGRLSSFSLEASVGAIPTITLGFEGTSLAYGAAINWGGNAAGGTAVDYHAALQTFTDVVVTLANASATHFANAQSVTISFDLGSEGLQRLGTTAAAATLVYARVPTLPATVTMEVEGLAVDKGMSLQLLNMNTKASSAGTTDVGGRATVSVVIGGSVTFSLLLATLDAVSYTNSIGDNATCSATFSCSVGSNSSPSRLTIT